MSEHDLAELESIASRLFDAFNRRDVEAAILLLDPEIVLRPVSAALMRGGEPYSGHEGIRTYFSDVQAHWEELVVHPVHIRAAGRAVVALGQAAGRAKTDSFNGRPTKWIIKFRDGLVVSIQIFADEPTPAKAPDSMP